MAMGDTDEIPLVEDGITRGLPDSDEEPQRPVYQLPEDEPEEPAGHAPAHHTVGDMPEAAERRPGAPGTVEMMADDCKAFFEALVARGFSRGEAVELVREIARAYLR